MTARTAFVLPGTGRELFFERDEETGVLVSLNGAGETYLTAIPGGERRLDGLAMIRESWSDFSVLRQVETATDRWVEEYRFDEDGHLAHVDGVEVVRDAQGRVVRCRSEHEDHDWRYAYGDGALVRVQNDGVSRRLTWERGRVVSVSVDGRRDEYRYDRNGHRTGLRSLPSTYHRDEHGRLWVVANPAGEVVTTYLWDGYVCLGRIDGPLGAPLAAVFSTDPTGTPVREIGLHGWRRLPRDAFGESLLEERGVPGLFGPGSTRFRRRLRVHR